MEEGEGEISIETFGDVDTYMTLFDGNRTEIVSSDDDGYGLNARISRSFAPGEYYVQISPLFLDQPGLEYAIEIRRR